MDETNLSWRAKLAKSNINILDIDTNNDIILVEFTYHPKPGVFKWCQTYLTIPANVRLEDGTLGEYTQTEVLYLRKELEG